MLLKDRIENKTENVETVYNLGKIKYLEMLPEILKQYSNTKHSNI